MLRQVNFLTGRCLDTYRNCGPIFNFFLLELMSRQDNFSTCQCSEHLQSLTGSFDIISRHTWIPLYIYSRWWSDVSPVDKTPKRLKTHDKRPAGHEPQKLKNPWGNSPYGQKNHGLKPQMIKNPKIKSPKHRIPRGGGQKTLILGVSFRGVLEGAYDQWVFSPLVLISPRILKESWRAIMIVRGVCLCLFVTLFFAPPKAIPPSMACIDNIYPAAGKKNCN